MHGAGGQGTRGGLGSNHLCFCATPQQTIGPVRSPTHALGGSAPLRLPGPGTGPALTDAAARERWGQFCSAPEHPFTACRSYAQSTQGIRHRSAVGQGIEILPSTSGSS